MTALTPTQIPNQIHWYQVKYNDTTDWKQDTDTKSNTLIQSQVQWLMILTVSTEIALTLMRICSSSSMSLWKFGHSIGQKDSADVWSSHWYLQRRDGQQGLTVTPVSGTREPSNSGSYLSEDCSPSRTNYSSGLSWSWHSFSCRKKASSRSFFSRKKESSQSCTWLTLIRSEAETSLQSQSGQSWEVVNLQAERFWTGRGYEGTHSIASDMPSNCVCEEWSPCWICKATTSHSNDMVALNASRWNHF